MSTYIQFLLLGIGSGAVFAALGLTLVVTYRASGVINFATGAIAMFCAYNYADLRQGQFLVPVPGLTSQVTINGGFGFLPAAGLALAETALLGLVLYLLVFRPLRYAPDVARAVASLGVMVALLALMLDRVGTNPANVGQLFPSGNLTVGSVLVPQGTLWFAAVVVLLAVVLAALYRFTPFGTATRAVAANEKGAIVSGVSPTAIGAWNWLLSALVAGIAGILIAPLVSLVPITYTLFIVPALAAAVIARFESVTIAVVAGIAIGMLQSELTYLTTLHSWLPQSGLADCVPLLLILMTLLVRSKALPGRGEIPRKSLGHAPRPRAIALPAVVGVCVMAAVLTISHGSLRDALITSMLLGLVCLSTVVVTGYAGQVSLAQLTLAGVAGFLLSDLTTRAHVPFPIAPILAALGAAVIGVVVGLPALRIRGLSVAIVTLALAVTLEDLWFNNNSLNGGGSGAQVAGPSLFGINLSAGVGKAFPRLSFALLCLVVTAVVGLAVAWLRRSRIGADMLAVRANERSAAAIGVNVVRVKLLAFGSAAFVAGIAGTMMAYQQTVVDSSQFDVFLGLGLFATAYIGGITSISGAALAGLLASGGVLYYELSRIGALSNWYDLVTGIALILTVILNPEGLIRPVHGWVARLPQRWLHPTATGDHGTVAASAAETEQSKIPRTKPADGASVEPALILRHISVTYGPTVALDDVSLTVPRGWIVGLIGPNGAGKTTLIDAATGFAACQGEVEIDGRRLEGLPAHRRARCGLVRTFQGVDLFNDLTVGENVVVGANSAHAEERGAVSRARDLLDLREVWGRPVAELSHGQRQLVSIARSLAMRPEVLLLDEPAAGLDTAESQILAERLRAVRDSGVSILLVDHDVHLVLSLCDVVHVLDLGKTIAEGTPDAVRLNPEVISAYLGEPAEESHLGRGGDPVSGGPVLQCRSLDAGYDHLRAVKDLNLSVAAGDVLTLLGPNGAGKTTLLLTISGFLPVLAGEVLVDGEPLPSGHPSKTNRNGVVLVPDDRALFSNLTVRQHLRMAHRGNGLDPDGVLELFPALRPKLAQQAGSLSGGEQQMLAIARAMVQDPRVLLIDEMSMGLAPIIIQALLGAIRKLADTAKIAIVVVEQHASLAVAMADHAAVLVHGALALYEEAAIIEQHPERLEEAYLGQRSA